MTVRERVLSSRILDWSDRNGQTARKLGIYGDLIKRNASITDIDTISEKEENNRKPVNP